MAIAHSEGQFCAAQSQASILGQSDARSGHSGRLLKIGCAAREFGCSPSMLRMWIREGKLLASRVGPNGKWRVLRSSLEALLSVPVMEGKSNDSDSGSGVAVYARKSCKSAADKAGLETQVGELLAYADANLGTSKENVRVYKEQQSGMIMSFRTRKALGKLYEDCRAGLIHTVIVKDKSRLSRLPGSTDLLERVFSDLGVTLVFSASNVGDVEDGELRDDIETLINFMTIVSNRRSGLKAAYHKESFIPEEHKEELVRLWGNGVSLDRLAKHCERHGIQGVRRNGVKVPLKKDKLRRWLILQGKANHFVAGVGGRRDLNEGQKTSLGEFHRECLKVSKGNYVPCSTVYARYCEWCQSRGMMPASKVTLGKFLATVGLKGNTYTIRGDRFRGYVDMALQSE